MGKEQRAVCSGGLVIEIAGGRWASILGRGGDMSRSRFWPKTSNVEEEIFWPTCIFLCNLMKLYLLHHRPHLPAPLGRIRVQPSLAVTSPSATTRKRDWLARHSTSHRSSLWLVLARQW